MSTNPGTTQVSADEQGMQVHGPARSLVWRLAHSWWLALALLSLGLLAWVGFAYLGLRTGRRRWLAWGVVYLGLAGAALSLLALGGSTNSTLEDVVGVLLWLGLWAGSLAHCLVIRREALLRLGFAQELRRARARELELRLAPQRRSAASRAVVAEPPGPPDRPGPDSGGSDGESGTVPVDPDPPQAPYASWGRRFGAWLVDATLLCLILFPIAVAVGAWVLAGESPVDQQTTGGAVIAVFVGFLAVTPLAFLYYAFLEGGKGGQTVGKRVLSIRVRRAVSLERVGYLRAALRTLVILAFWTLGSVPIILVPPILVDALWPLSDSKNQALHDKLCRTVVVRASSPQAR